MSTTSVTESLLLNSITIIIVGALVFHKENFLRFRFEEGIHWFYKYSNFINTQFYVRTSLLRSLRNFYPVMSLISQAVVKNVFFVMSIVISCNYHYSVTIIFWSHTFTSLKTSKWKLLVVFSGLWILFLNLMFLRCQGKWHTQHVRFQACRLCTSNTNICKISVWRGVATK